MEGTFGGVECVNYSDNVVLRGRGQQPCKRGLVSSGGGGGTKGVGCVKKKRKSVESGSVVENVERKESCGLETKDSTQRSGFVEDVCEWLLGKWSVGDDDEQEGGGVKRSGKVLRLSGVCDMLSDRERSEELFGVLAKGGRLCRRVKKCDAVKGLKSSGGVLVLSTVVSDLRVIGGRFFGGAGGGVGGVGGGRLSSGLSKISGEILQGVYKAMHVGCVGGDVSAFRLQRVLRECYVRYYVPLDVCFALKGYMVVCGWDCTSGGGGGGCVTAATEKGTLAVCEYAYVDEFFGGASGSGGGGGGGGYGKNKRGGKSEVLDWSEDDDDCGGGGSECYSTDGFVVEDSDEASCKLFGGSSEYSRSSDDEHGDGSGSGSGSDDDDSEEFFSCVSSECGGSDA